ncbi:DNA-3-methyladenine glycosylase family protein [Gordonia sp. (in: high G+C Gram-positive bacteria)]|uniref:DNA-3-methyladenine glycosylase family protein n=1 Tax=Gordonia sp. (in: high G+C Gram-positive bacteria) TaxID=84139 RepID=UPI0039E5177A
MTLTRTWTPTFPVDVRTTVGAHRRGTGDPSTRFADDGSVWRATQTPDGPGTLHLRAHAGSVRAQAWGPGAAWLIDQFPDLLGAADDPAALDTDHPVVRQLQRRARGLRLGRTDRVWEALVPAVLEQKVVGTEAWRAWRYLVRRYGEPAPGPTPAMHVPPPRREWAHIPSWEWHRSGAEPVRMRTITRAAGMDVERGADHLTALRGIGPWTEAEVRRRALGDPDAVPVGDYHLPSVVGHTLIGEAVDDAGMLELLEPFAGQRGRVVRLCELHGTRPARRGPRMSVRDYRAM